MGESLAAAISSNMGSQNTVLLQPTNIQPIIVQNGNVGMLLMNGLNGQQYGRQVTGYNAGNNNNGNNYYYDNNGGYAQQSQSQHNTGQYATNYNQNTTSLNTGSSV